MGLFSKKKVPVNVMGYSSMSGGADGRYDKQAKENRKAAKQHEKELELNARSAAELRAYIEDTYRITELSLEDERYHAAYAGVKAHLVFRDAPELIRTPLPKQPAHPPVSENDPDYAALRRAEDDRFREAVTLPPEQFPIHLHVYNIPIMQNDRPVCWLEVYVEMDHEYLAFKPIVLEYEDTYQLNRVISDIVRYFGASAADKKAKNERYVQFISVM